jgi:hypothetical protein
VASGCGGVEVWLRPGHALDAVARASTREMARPFTLARGFLREIAGERQT